MPSSKNDNSNSIIGKGSSFEGNFYISGSLYIDGNFQGEIHTEDSLVIGESGRVKTNIKAREAIISGVLEGNIEATGKVELAETCRMLGDIRTPYLKISHGTVVKGRIEIDGGQKKPLAKLLSEKSFSGDLPKDKDTTK